MSNKKTIKQNKVKTKDEKHKRNNNQPLLILVSNSMDGGHGGGGGGGGMTPEGGLGPPPLFVWEHLSTFFDTMGDFTFIALLKAWSTWQCMMVHKWCHILQRKMLSWHWFDKVNGN